MSEELHLLQTLTQAIGVASDLPSVLGVALRQICQLTNWDYGEAWLPRPEGTGLELSWAPAVIPQVWKSSDSQEPS